MLMIEYKDMGWWYWLVTAVLLSAGVAGEPTAFLFAIGLTVIQLIHYLLREKSIRSFPVQVRFFYLLLLILALPEPMRWIFWIPTIGTWAQIIFGYCTMARCVSLLPWNAAEPFSWQRFKQTFFSRPVRGNVMQGFAESE